MTQEENLFVLELPLKVESWQADILNVRFELMRRLYNYALRILLRHFYYYIEQRKDFRSCKNLKEKSEYIKQHPVTIKGITDKKGQPKSIFFSERSIKEFVTQLIKQDIGSGKSYLDFGINSTYAECIGANLWAAWNKWLYEKKCRKIHYKKKDCFNTISVRKKNKYFGGMNLDLEQMCIAVNINGKQGSNCKKIILPIRYNSNSEYETQVLSYGIDAIHVVAIVRKNIRGRYKYYLQLTLAGVVPSKNRTIGEGKVGIDLGPSTIAVSSDSKVYIEKLVSECDDIEKKVSVLQRKMDRSRRENNPQNCNEDGTIRRISRSKGERRIWNCSRRYMSLLACKKELQRKQAAVRKMSHILRANDLLPLGRTFVVENNPISAWSRRSMETKVSDKTGRYQKKKRFGHSIANHAPSMFITILENKLHALGGNLYKVKLDNAASRYDFTSGQFTEHKVNERTIMFSNGHRHQRDLVAAFNLQHIDLSTEQSKKYDVEQMRADYPRFCKLEASELDRYKNNIERFYRSTIGAEKDINEVLSSLADDKLMLKGGWSANAFLGIETGTNTGSVLAHESADSRVLEVQRVSNLLYNKDVT